MVSCRPGLEIPDCPAARNEGNPNRPGTCVQQTRHPEILAIFWRHTVWHEEGNSAQDNGECPSCVLCPVCLMSCVSDILAWEFLKTRVSRENSRWKTRKRSSGGKTGLAPTCGRHRRPVSTCHLTLALTLADPRQVAVAVAVDLRF